MEQCLNTLVNISLRVKNYVSLFNSFPTFPFLNRPVNSLHYHYFLYLTLTNLFYLPVSPPNTTNPIFSFYVSFPTYPSTSPLNHPSFSLKYRFSTSFFSCCLQIPFDAEEIRRALIAVHNFAVPQIKVFFSFSLFSQIYLTVWQQCFQCGQ